MMSLKSLHHGSCMYVSLLYKKVMVFNQIKKIYIFLHIVLEKFWIVDIVQVRLAMKILKRQIFYDSHDCRHILIIQGINA